MSNPRSNHSRIRKLGVRTFTNDRPGIGSNFYTISHISALLKMRSMVSLWIRLLALSQVRICRPPHLSFDPIFMEDAQCAETNEQSIFRSIFFWVIVKIHRKLGYKNDHNSKTEIWFVFRFRIFHWPLFYIIILMYACKTLKPGLTKYAVHANLFRLRSTNPNKNRIFFFQMLNIWTKNIYISFSKAFKFTWKMQNLKKNQIFIFKVLIIFVPQFW